jgi:hypothetical protein
MSYLLDLNMIGELVEDLNKELLYKAGEHTPLHPDTRMLALSTDGSDHRIYFLGMQIYSTRIERNYEDIPVEVDMELNERENFEPLLRQLINDQLDILKNIHA